MTLLAIRTFGGLSPKTPPYALPDNGAQEAVDCDFSHGDLRGIDGLFPLTNASCAAHSLYSEDGIRFYAWPDDVDAVRSPQAADQYHRMYFTQGGVVKTAFSDMMPLTPAPPGTVHTVGVPTPTALPTSELKDKDTLPLEATSLTGKFWYESSGQHYQAGDIALAQVKFGRQYTATAPALDEDTPAGATPCLQIIGKKDDSTVFTLTSDTSSSFVRNTAIDGGAALSLTYTDLALTAHIDYGAADDRAYVYTHVNLYGEESAPSEPVAVSFDTMQKVYIHVPYTPPSSDYFQVTTLRLYRTNTASTGYAQYQFVKDQGVSAGGDISILDDVDAAALGEIIESTDWYPPATGLSGLVNLGNGILAAFRNNELHFCEAYVPYAWNPFNVVTLPYNVVGLCPHLGGMVVVTSANPYLVSGVSSDAMTASKLPAIQGGIAKRAIADLGSAVVYASNDGLVAISGGDASLELGQMFWTRHDWRADWATPVLQLAAHDGYIIGSLPAGAKNFIVRLDEAAGTLTNFSQWSTGAFLVPAMDGLYYAQGNQIYRFTGAGRMPFVWWSKDFLLKKPENFGVAQVVLGNPSQVANLKIEFYADGVKKYEKSVTSQGGYLTFRLPSGFMARRWSFRLSGDGIIKEFFVATAGVELGNL